MQRTSGRKNLQQMPVGLPCTFVMQYHLHKLSDLFTGISTQSIPTVVRNAIAINRVFWVVLLFVILTMVNVFANRLLLLEDAQSAPMAVIIYRKTIFLVAVVSFCQKKINEAQIRPSYWLVYIENAI